jgi:hypothetical protein
MEKLAVVNVWRWFFRHLIAPFEVHFLCLLGELCAVGSRSDSISVTAANLRCFPRLRNGGQVIFRISFPTDQVFTPKE